MNDVENFYPLSPMQQGMLFHCLMAPASGMYHEQVSWVFRGELSELAYQRAWQKIVDRHAVLRTVFIWEDLEQPIQIVREKVSVNLERQDWRGVASQQRFTALLDEDRKRGFELSQAPLMRLTLIQTGDDVYQFLWSYHHLLLDGWSASLVIDDLATAYAGICRGHDVQFPTRRSYRDFIKWLKQQNVAESERFWREKLKGFSAPTLLPVAKTPAGIDGEQNDCAIESTSLPGSLTQSLQNFGRTNHVTLNTLIQAAWALFLHRYSGESDILFGATVAGRPTALEGVESMIGVFINTLPVRVQLSAEDSVARWLQRLQDQFGHLRRFEHTPLVDVQRWSEAPRGLFESLLVFENFPINASHHDWNANLMIEGRRYDTRTNYALTLLVNPGSEMKLQLLYHCNRFDAAMIRQMLSHLQCLLEGMCAEPNQRLSELAMLTNAERHQLLVEWNDTGRDYPKDKCVHELIEAQVAKTPEATAVVFEDEELTYGELNRRANQLAHYLRKLGVGPEVLVGICVERSVEMVVGLMGILKAGGAYVPLDPGYPRERLAYVIGDAQVKVVVTQQELAARLAADARVVCLDGDDSIIVQESEHNPEGAAGCESRAYVIYTSGSTGRPKGVEITHRGVVNFLSSMGEQPGMKETDIVLAVTTISFDIAGLELYLPLMTGARVVIASRETAADGARLSRYIDEVKATVMQATPATWQMLLSAGWPGRKQLKVLCGGEALSGELAGELLERAESVWNLYGPTESTIWSTLYRVGAEERSVPIGRPVANTEIYILDRHMQPVPIGVPGELHIGGAGLARGYLNRPELTAEKFIVNPFSDDPDARLYKTGDLARYRADGNIEYLGRLDHQVKIRGFRIELGEIESVLSQHPGIGESVVVAREEEAGDKRLVAYMVCRSGLLPSAQELRSYLREKLPDYMVPAAFVTLEALPLTPNGKIDRKALPPPDRGHAEPNVIVTPRTEIEKTIAEIWRRLLKIEAVGIYDNFFDLGGHSLLMARAHSQLRASLRPEISMVDLFRYPTISSLAEFLSAAPERCSLVKTLDRAEKQQSALLNYRQRTAPISRQRAGERDL